MKKRYFATIVLTLFCVQGCEGGIPIPNLLTAMQRSKQKRSMADMRTIATAWEAYETDTNSYAPPGRIRSVNKLAIASTDQTTFTWPSETVTYSELKAMLAPKYIKTIPQKDGWGHDFDFAFWSGNGTNDPGGCAIRSRAKDGVADGTTYKRGTGTRSLESDLVYSNGSFIQWNEGSLP
jgi:general secretion pathway protein G